MTDRCHIEKLRDMLNTLEYDAQFLYQYGDLSSSWDVFESLSNDDQKRLIALALIEGNSDVQNVARFLMGRLMKPPPSNLDNLLLQMNPEDRKEVETIRSQILGGQTQAFLTMIDQRRIVEELHTACDLIGMGDIEEAYWVLIPREVNNKATWIKAMGGARNEFYSRFGSSFQVGYAPDQEELYELITAMQKASWVLHVHNHPTSPVMGGTVLPSEKDMAFASHWKSLRPELVEKMMFFVIQSNMAMEYSYRGGGIRQWL